MSNERPSDPQGRGDQASSDGPILPDYEIIRQLGAGGMGVLYLAHNTLMDRLDALKVLARHLVDQPSAVERFLREIKAAAALDHRNIVRVYNATRSAGDLILIMEYVDGEDLGARVERLGRLPVAESCFYAFQAAQGLQHAHGKELVHRDVKPQNLILDLKGGKGLVKILDFGLAKLQSEGPVAGGITRDNSALGSPDFVAPEQIRDARSADIRADIYGLGCTLHFLLSGSAPFAGAKSLWDIFQAHMSQDAAPLDGIRPDVPVELAALVAKMMAKDPAARFQTPGEVAAALRPFVQPGTAKTPPVKKAEDAPSPGSKRSGTIVEPVPLPNRKSTLVEDVSPTARRSTMVEGIPPAARESTFVEGIPLGDVAPPLIPTARRSTFVEGGAAPVGLPPRGGARGSTIAEDGPGDAFPRDFTIVEALPQRGGMPTKSKVPQPMPTPIWRRPEMLAGAGIVAAASVALGLYLARSTPEGQKPEVKGRTPEPLAVGPAARPGAQETSKVPNIVGGQQKTGTSPNNPGIPNGLANPNANSKATASRPGSYRRPPDSPGSVAGLAEAKEVPGPSDDSGGFGTSDSSSDSDTRPTGSASKGASGKAKPPVRAYSLIVDQPFEAIAASPDGFEGQRFVPNDKGIKMSPKIDFTADAGYRPVSIARLNDAPLSASDSKAKKEYRLHVVLDPTLLPALKRFFEEQVIRQDSAWRRIIPTLEVRRDEGTDRWLAVIVALELAVRDNPKQIKAGNEAGAFDLYKIDLDGHRKVSSGEGDRFERLGGESRQKKLMSKEARDAIATANKKFAMEMYGSGAAAGKRMGDASAAEGKATVDRMKRAVGGGP